MALSSYITTVKHHVLSCLQSYHVFSEIKPSFTKVSIAQRHNKNNTTLGLFLKDFILFLSFSIFVSLQLVMT